eukprot:scaffold34649_cov158-Amphora_coffeaeformis.AAC.4
MKPIVSTRLILLLVCAGHVRGFVTGTTRRGSQAHVSVSPPSKGHVRSTKTDDSSQPAARPLYRNVRQIQKYARLPVWPAWNGVFIFLVSKLLGQDRAAQLEDVMTGRVCPNFFQENDDTSPFIMLVHHCHTFAPVDPLRYFQRLFFPEGKTD